VKRHFDVIVLGRSIGALTAAAVLARRDFTTLVLGNGSPSPAYSALDLPLERRPPMLLGATSPCWLRVLSELAQTQTWRRRLVPAEPALQALAPGFRVDLSNDAGHFAREIDREFPELYHVVEQLYRRLDAVDQAADEAFDKDAIWPPGTFWERRETGKHAARLPYVHAEPDADLLSEFPRGHFYRRLVRASVLFGTNFSTLPPPFAIARLHGAWRRSSARLAEGDAELERFLVERIESHGGQCRLGDRAAAIHLRRGVAAGVVLENDDQPTGCEFVLTDLDGESVAQLAGGQGIHKSALREWPRITSTVARFVVSLVARTEGLPEPLARSSILFVDPASHPRGYPQAIHLTRTPRPGGLTTLSAEIMWPDHGSLELAEARRFVLAPARAAVPLAAPARRRLPVRWAPRLGDARRRRSRAAAPVARALAHRAHGATGRGRSPRVPRVQRRAGAWADRAHPPPRPERAPRSRSGGRAPGRLERCTPGHEVRSAEGDDAPGHLDEDGDRLKSRGRAGYVAQSLPAPLS
jgi:phytoene dehydrogenase-like protein